MQNNNLKRDRSEIFMELTKTTMDLKNNEKDIKQEDFQKEVNRIADNIIAYICRQSVSYAISERVLEVVSDTLKNDLILCEKN